MTKHRKDEEPGRVNAKQGVNDEYEDDEAEK